jgi:endonuclease YncB( thermonuclease family)
MIALQSISFAGIRVRDRYRVVLLVVLISTLLLAWCEASPDVMLTGRILRVEDSDVVVLLGPGNAQHKVRLLGIDAPDTGQPYAEAAKDYLATRVVGRFVVVEYGGRDPYGSILGKVVLSGSDLGLEQISAGMAWHSKRDQDLQSPADQRAYAKAEEQARQAQMGLWFDSCPVAPWVWREPRRPEQRALCDKRAQEPKPIKPEVPMPQ